jgi:hypothetical protein
MSAKEKVYLALAITAWTHALKLFINSVLPSLLSWLVARV